MKCVIWCVKLNANNNKNNIKLPPSPHENHYSYKKELLVLTAIVI